MGAKLTGAPTISWRADHAACTCRMSDDPRQGVTDRNLRVHGVDNLYVCSNAVFPNIGSVNPTLTLTALALRLGEHLNEQLGAH
jgi:choline dehydrogenase-like flavoprotein